VNSSNSNHLIGQVVLKSNEDSNFTEREFKSIDIDREWKYFKIVFGQWYNNKLNVFNQIAITNISCFGNIMEAENDNNSGTRNTLMNTSNNTSGFNINSSEILLMTKIPREGNGMLQDGNYDLYIYF
jgi:hypothetical protein